MENYHNTTTGQPAYLMKEDFVASNIQTQSPYADNLDLNKEAGYDTLDTADDILDFTERNPFGTYALIPANVVMIGMMNRLLRDKADGDEKVIATCDWIDQWLDWCSSQEIWARSQKFWDDEFDGKVPDLFFLPDDAVEKARAVKLED